jgi:hypothetical protein
MPAVRDCAARRRSYTLHALQKQGSFCLDEHLTLYAREASVAPAAPVQTAISEITTPLA